MNSDLQPLEHQEGTSSIKQETPRKKEKKASTTKQDLFQVFLTELEKESSVEGKIQKAIVFMKDALAQAGSPRFKDFWEARKVCLPLFKETMPPAQRATLWNEYIEISSEARRLKEILDEQTAYSVEQIELAIKAVKEDLDYHLQSEGDSAESFFGKDLPESLQGKNEYSKWQNEINFLNTLASRINSLRKELMRTEMRIRVKNRLFESLSEIGDQIFPKRKDLIKQISDKFEEDVNSFIAQNFENLQDSKIPYFVLKDEIKSLQNFAKLIALNTHAFSETRLKLSSAWDQIKELEKERKKEISVKRAQFKENAQQAFAKIEDLKAYCEQENATLEESNKMSDDIFSLMRTLELSREDVRELKDHIALAKKVLLDKAQEEKLAKVRLEQEKREARLAKIQTLKQGLEEVLSSVETTSKESLETKREEIKSAMEELHLSKLEKLSFDTLFKHLQDVITEKQELALLNLSEGDREVLDQLEKLLSERKNDRKAIREQLENYRKSAGVSGLDFEKAMAYSELIDAEKARLEKVNNAICDLDEKIKQLKGV